MRTRGASVLAVVVVMNVGAACPGVVDIGGSRPFRPGSGGNDPGTDEPGTGDPGTGDPGTGDPDDPDTCGPTDVGPSPLRRLTRWEYNNTVFDLLGDDTHPADALDPESVVGGFDNNVDGAPMNVDVVSDYAEIAFAVAARATTDLATLLSCDVATTGQDECVREFIAAFGRKAFRRPLTLEEQTRFEDFAGVQLAEVGLRETVEMIVASMLQSPQFLYRLEFMNDGEVEGTPEPLGPYEVATRLSYLLWGSTPDDALLDAAERDELRTPAQLEAQARRMIDDPVRGGRALQSFMLQWSSLVRLQQETRNGGDFRPETAALLQREFVTFVDEVVRRGDGLYATLLSAPFSFMNDRVARYYGLPEPGSDEFVRVDLDAARSAGFLTQAGFMALMAHPEQQSTVRRGVFVLEKLLCTEIPPPPCAADLTLPDVDPDTTSRERLETKTGVQPCIACHSTLNPAGYAFEHYNQLGLYRETEGNGLPIDSSGHVWLDGADRPVSGATDLARALASSRDARSCLVDHWFRFAAGRSATSAERCAVDGLKSSFADNGGNIKELMVALTQTPSFAYRMGEAP